ncbi:hypothetical protein [Fusibacter sp. JL216-2]|uniref:hypothetical protein n=1 Tax=Fusibacter sp. JL216-2 TaxID=3071453 RepID=UPI003D325BC3
MNQMKKQFIAFVLASSFMFLLSGCSESNEIGYKTQIEYKEQYCKAFNEAVESSNPTINTISVIEKCKNNLDQETFTKYVLRYEKLLIEEKAEFSNKIFDRGNHEDLYSYFPNRFNKSGIENIKEPDLKAVLLDLVRSGYTLEKSDMGLYKVEIDYEILKRFEGHIAREATDYFELMALEKQKPLIDENGIVGDPVKAMERLMKYDLYINRYPKSQRLLEVSNIANEYLLAMVFGYEDNHPYDESDLIKPVYYDIYLEIASYKEETLMTKFIAGLVEALNASDRYWTEDVYNYIIHYPEFYRKRYLNSSVYPDAFVDVAYGWTSTDSLYYYPVFSGITDRAEEGKLNLMARSIIEKRMLGQGFDGMYTGGSYIWSDFELTFNRRNWISLRIDIYTEQADESYYWTTEALNYNLKEKKNIRLRDVVGDQAGRDYINNKVKAFFEESRTYYAVSLEDFYKNSNPDFYLSDTGIYILVPVNMNTETTERVVEIFIPFEKFNTSVEYIYKIPEQNME